MSRVTTPACRLRPIEPTDVPVLYEHQADPEAAALAAVPGRDRRAHATHWDGILADSRTVLRAVVVPDAVGGERLAGYLTVFDRDGHRELGYWYGREFWGRGLASAALSRFLDAVTERPLVAHVAVQNPASAAVLLQNGFREVGTHTGEDGVVLRDFLLG